MIRLSSVLPVRITTGIDSRTAVWAVIALLAGVCVAVLPPQSSMLVIGAAILFVASLIDVRVALFVTLTIAPLKTLIETEHPLSLPLDIGQLALMATIAIWLMRSIATQRRLNLVWTPIFVPVMLFTIAASFSLWVAISPGTAMTELSKWIEILAIIALIVSLIRENASNAGWVTAALIVTAAVQTVIGVYEFRGGSGAAHLWILDFRYFRAFGSFGQPNPFGAFMGLTLPVAIGAAIGAIAELTSPTAPLSVYIEGEPVYNRNSVKPYLLRRYVLSVKALIAALYIVGALIIAIGLLVSWSRGAWIGFAAAAVAMFFFLPRRRLIGVALLAVMLVGAIVGAVGGLIPASLVARVSDFSQDLTGLDDVRGQVISDANYAVLERLAHWQAALAMATDAPWLGVGFGNYEAAYPRYQLMNWRYPLGHAHNYYLNLLAETGVVGLGAYIAAWIGIFALTLRVLNRSRGFQRGLALGLLGAWVHLAVHSVFDKLYVNNMFLHIGVMLGLIGGLFVLNFSIRTEHYIPSR